jgi:nitrous oxidase accessory protein NosD
MYLKKLATLFPLALALALGLMIFGGQQTQAAGPWYVSMTGNDENDCLSPATACLTLQAAINKASSGDTVNVEAGVYPHAGVVTVNKTLTLKGAQAGFDARVRFDPESTLENSGGLYVTANDVVIDGFTIQNSTSGAFTGYGIALGAGTSGAHVINNIIQNNIVGLGLSNHPSGTQAEVQYNVFRNNTQPGPASGHGIYTDQFVAGVGGVEDVLIANNNFETDEVSAANTFGIGISNTGAAPFTALQIHNNKFDSVSLNSRGMYFFGTESSSIKSNSIRNKTNYAIRFLGGNDKITIECNTILESNRGIHVSAGVNSNITVKDNNIAGNLTSGLEVAAGTYTGVLNAENNWWNSPTGPTTPTNPGGTGDKIIDPDGVVDFTPFRTALIDDSDEDGVLDPCDVGCPAPSVCGCGIPETDGDGDGVPDCIDNCPAQMNPGQEDADEDGVGDACDNCAGPNPSQVDTDGDGFPDECDNCPSEPNPSQVDFDLDGIGDACDAEQGHPTMKDQCKDGGWERFILPRRFKNQGDCIQYLNTGK